LPFRYRLRGAKSIGASDHGQAVATKSDEPESAGRELTSLPPIEHSRWNSPPPSRDSEGPAGLRRYPRPWVIALWVDALLIVIGVLVLSDIEPIDATLDAGEVGQVASA